MNLPADHLQLLFFFLASIRKTPGAANDSFCVRVYELFAGEMGTPTRTKLSPALQYIEHGVALAALGYVAYHGVSAVRTRGLVQSISELFFSAVRSLPGASNAIDSALKSALQPMVDELVPPDASAVTALPEDGLDRITLSAALEDMATRDLRSFASGREFGGIYHAHQGELIDVQNTAMIAFNATNALYPGQFNSLRKMEAEIVAMTVSLLKGQGAEDPAPEACGLLTTGGTESILLAIKAHKEAAIASGRPGPYTVIAGLTAHPALDKACSYFGLRLVKLAVDHATQELSVESVRSAIRSCQVACVYASAPTFCHGAIDPIPALAELCATAGVPLHIDNCLGGVLYSAAIAAGLRYRDFGVNGAEEGIPLPPFDFSVPGVTTVSIDVHKYGNAPKGASVVAFRSPSLRSQCFTTVTDWPGGLYATQTMTGSRGGASIAAAWATLRFFGRAGYRAMAIRTHGLHQRVAAAVNATPGLTLLGRPALSSVAFTAVAGSGRDIYALAARLSEKGGWHLNELQGPPGLQLCISERFGACIDDFLADLAACTAEWIADPVNPRYRGKGSAGIYGAAGFLPPGEISSVLRAYCDIMTMVRPLAHISVTDAS